MREQDAKDWLQTQFSVSRETWGRLEAYVAILLEEMEQQNLIAESTRPHIWARHIVDSAQLIPLASTAEDGLWIDLGSGAGLPGIVVAILTDRPVQMVDHAGGGYQRESLCPITASVRIGAALILQKNDMGAAKGTKRAE
jgi:16S rRNA (guanine527-N7)-methyltransferase